VSTGPAGAPTAAADRLDAVLERLHAEGVRRTGARRDVLRVLAAAASHLTIAEIRARIAQRGDALDESTAHRTLATLTRLGVVHAVTTGEATSYALTEQPHLHAVCRICHRVQDIPAADLPANWYAHAVAGLGETGGFSWAAVDLTVTGDCPDCQAR
jgi:Fur family ferric uptake transcriptional regulator